MSKKIIFLPSSMSPAGLQAIAERSDIEAISYDLNTPIDKFHDLLANAHGVGLSLARFGDAEIAVAPNLKVIARHGVGYDLIDVAAATRARLPVMITGIANSPSVAEHALYLMLELAKRGLHYHSMMADGRWGQRMSKPLPTDLFEKTLLIVGFGRIGTRLAKIALALGMNVCVYDPYVAATQIRDASCAPESDLNDALTRADYVSIHCPKNADTTRLISTKQFAQMKPSACIINTARGGIIDESALHAALTGNQIAGAGLDVVEQEPPAADHPLLKLPNVILAPHMAGVTKEALDRMAVAMVSNLLSVLDGKPNMENVVNKAVYEHH